MAKQKKRRKATKEKSGNELKKIALATAIISLLNALITLIDRLLSLFNK